MRGERQHAAILQQHNAVGTYFADYLGVSLQVGSIVIFVSLEVVGLHHIFQNALYVGIEHLHGQRAVLCGSQDGVVLLRLSGLQHIVASQHGSHGIVAGVPVADVHALPAPFIANDGGQQLTVLHGIRPVQLVIRRHDSPRVALLHHDFEGLQVNLAKGTLRDLRDVVVAVCLLIVGHEVLRTGRSTLALHTMHIAGGDGAREIRVLRVILMVAAAQRITDKVHGRRENPVEAKLAYLVADALPYLESCLTVPRRGQRHRGHEVGGVIVAMVPRPLGIHTQALLGVGAIGLGNAQALHSEGTARRAGELVIVIIVHTSTQHQVALLFQRHRLHHLVDVISGQLLG